MQAKKGCPHVTGVYKCTVCVQLEMMLDALKRGGSGVSACSKCKEMVVHAVGEPPVCKSCVGH